MITRHTEIRVGYRDTDQMGVVHHAVYLEFFEQGRTELLRQIGIAYATLERSGVMLPVLEYDARLVRPALYDQIVRVESTLHPPDGVRLRIAYTITRNDQLLVTGHTIHAFAQVGSMKPIRPPREFLELLAGVSSR